MSHTHIVAIGATGGTISMASLDRGGPATPSLQGEDLAAPLHQWLPDVTVRSTSLFSVGSPQLRIADVLAVARFASNAVRDGAHGVVIIQGTDTLEETAYLLDLIWDRPEPLVVTGAMRASDDAGAEGMGNLVAAVRVALDERTRNMGVLVVLNDEAHLASLVRKVDANALSAFKSLSWGPVARVVEGDVTVVYRPVVRHPALPYPQASPPRIPIVTAGLDDDGELMRLALHARPRGIVISAMGSGHVPVPLADAAEEMVNAGIPVVFASRTGGGTTTQNTYGYPGSEVDLLNRGLIGAGWLDGRKSRLLLHTLVSAGADRESIAAEFSRRGRG
ncbi:asparaginase [Schaalia sp. ZJ405]|uniref:asparaginase n=1 Tax=Schaalia sp. ZJ405 TaxID=2709403 RepID=UPI0013EBDC12|nr:asparaginase [Schaalia sp. ZJ405]QPK81741.1 asparaginase [Schaalia sp. ZJ405]